MKHLIFLILLVFASCSGDKGSVFTVPANDSNNNTSKNGNGGTNIFDDIIPSANAGVIESENGCIDGFSKFTVYSNTESYHSCIIDSPITLSSFVIRNDYYYVNSQSTLCWQQYGMSTCRREQIKSASVQGVINLTHVNFIFNEANVTNPWDSAAFFSVSYLNDSWGGGWAVRSALYDSSVTSAQEYCCYR